MFPDRLRNLAKVLGAADARRSKARKAKRQRLSREWLESRNMLAPLAWVAGASLPNADAGIVVQPEGAKSLVLGGSGVASYNLSAADPAWQASYSPAVESLDFARSSPGVGPLPNGLFVVFGGLQNGFATSAVTQYDPNTLTIVDGATNQTRSLHAMNVPRAMLGWATDATSGRSYAIGGVDNNATPLASVEAYNPSANSWSYMAALPQALDSESAVSDGAGHLFVFGGVGADGTLSGGVYRYTIATNAWDQVASLPVAVRDSAAVMAPDGMIYVLGGKTAAGATAAVQSYDIAANAWTVDTSLPIALSSAAATVDSLGRIEVLGGYGADGNATAAVYVSQKLTQADLAPAITSSAPASVVVNSSYAYQVLSAGNPQPSYSLAAAPPGLSIDANTGLISWAPSYATEGRASVTVVASNRAGQATQTFSIGVAPAPPTGLSGAGTSTTSSKLSWDASPDPNVTGYDVYRRTFVHSPRGSGGSYYYSRIATDVPTNSLSLSGTYATGVYLVSAVNSAGIESVRSAAVSVAAYTAPSLWGAMTTGGADISSLSLSVGQTGQIYLLAYGNPRPAFSVVNGPADVSVDSQSGLVTFKPGPSEIGNVVVTFAATNAAGTSTNTFTFFVSALAPEVTLNGGETTYDASPHAASAVAIGADGSTPVAGSFAFTYNGDPAPPTAAGVYNVVATFTSGDPSYASTSATTTLTIDPATPAISLSGGPFDFDGASHSIAATALGVDGLTPVDGSFQIDYNGSPSPPTDPGLYAVTAAFTSNDPNYASTTTLGNLIINSPGSLAPSLSLVDGSAPYDGGAHADQALAVGLDGSTPVAGSFLITYNGDPTPPTQAGAYALAAEFISSDPNYANAAISGMLTISPASPTLSFGSNTFTYNGAAQQAGVTALGVDLATPVNGVYNVTYNGSATPPVDAGVYEVEVAFTSNDPNYLSTSAIGSLTILPAAPSVGLGNGGQWQFTYDGAPQSVVGSAVGIDGLTPINGTFAYEYYNAYGSNTQLFGPPLPGAPTDAGYYTFIEYFTSQDPNYADGQFSYDLWINPASPTVALDGGPFTYNGAAQSASVTATGVDGVTPVAGSVTYATYNGSPTAPSGAGSYAVYAEFASADPNYYGATVEGTLVINKATPAFSSLSSPAVNLGAASATVSGRIAAGSLAPGGDDVAITLNGVTLPAAINSSGNFSAVFNTQGLAAGTYTIGYAFLGDGARFNAAAAGSGTLTVRAAPSVLTNPASQTVASGGSVTFTASASGFPAPSVQWQLSTNGSTFANIRGATGLSYTINAVTASQNGYRYRAVFTNSAGSATTAAATLTVQSAPSVTKSPSSLAVAAGQTATFTASAAGSPATSVQWQVSIDGGKTYASISGATNSTLTLSGVAAGQNGYRYRAVFTNSLGSATTNAASLRVR